MYFPIFRGRQYELLALRECVERKILHNKIIPIVEPVRASSTFVKTIETFIQSGHSIALIHNPLVGYWDKDLLKTSNEYIKDKLKEWHLSKSILPAVYVTNNLKSDIESLEQFNYSINDIILICNESDSINIYNNVISGNSPKFNLIPDKREFRRSIRPNRVLCEDHFHKQERNVDYLNRESEFFSSDHLYFKDDGYTGFADYSVIGASFSEIGFAPYAVAIHIVYFDEEKNLRIAHFVSDSNYDISDPAGKFAEAVEKLVIWNKNMNLSTFGIKSLIEIYNKQIFPGLGVIKKFSIMHHLQLMTEFFNEEEK